MKIADLKSLFEEKKQVVTSKSALFKAALKKLKDDHGIKSLDEAMIMAAKVGDEISAKDKVIDENCTKIKARLDAI